MSGSGGLKLPSGDFGDFWGLPGLGSVDGDLKRDTKVTKSVSRAVRVPLESVSKST